MAWSERQIAMLDAMGLRVWQPAPDGVPDDPSAVPAQDASRLLPAGEPVVPARSWPAAVQPPFPSAAATSPERSVAERPVAGLGRAAQEGAGVQSVPVAVEHLDWQDLRDTVAGCTACKLCEGRRQTVFGVGNLKAHWLIVGEAPGEQEDREGEPFVGKSGQLLDNMLRAVGLGRQEGDAERQVYIANTVKCRPPLNRNPEPAELATCEPYLMRQIALVQPRIILAMGRFAVQSLLRSTEPIGRLRGRVHTYMGVPLVVTYHPAYLLRNPEDKARAWDDLCLAREALLHATA